MSVNWRIKFLSRCGDRMPVNHSVTSSNTFLCYRLIERWGLRRWLRGQSTSQLGGHEFETPEPSYNLDTVKCVFSLSISEEVEGGDRRSLSSSGTSYPGTHHGKNTRLTQRRWKTKMASQSPLTIPCTHIIHTDTHTEADRQTDRQTHRHTRTFFFKK